MNRLAIIPRCRAAALASLLIASPVAAQSVRVVPVITGPGVSRFEGEMISFSEFVLELNRAESPAVAAFASLGPEMRGALRLPDRSEKLRRMRAAIDRVAAALDVADDAVARLRLPATQNITSPPELQPAAQQHAIASFNRQMRDAMKSAGEMIDAMSRDDSEAATKSAQIVLRSIILTLDTQELLARGQAAASSRKSGAAEIYSFKAAFLHLYSRLLNANAFGGTSKIDLVLADDLSATADQVDSLRVAYLAETSAHAKEIAARAADARARNDAASLSLAEKMGRIAEAGRPAAGLMSQFSTIVRQTAAVARTKPIDRAVIDETISLIDPLKDQFRAMADDENRAAAGTLQ